MSARQNSGSIHIPKKQLDGLRKLKEKSGISLEKLVTIAVDELLKKEVKLTLTIKELK